jgi:precorrin-2 dehydrogenase / sirohydrochlorin ferrochelatase
MPKRYYPLFLDISERDCLVVGGGKVGARKAKALLAAGARVVVVSPVMDAALEALLPNERLFLKKRAYRSSDMAGVFLVIGATDLAELNRRIKRDAQAAKALCNVADQPQLCDFILPAVVNQGDLAVAITTAGKSPALAKRLRRQLQAQFGSEYAELTTLLGVIRTRLLAAGHDPEGHRRVLNALLDEDILGLLKAGHSADINALLKKILGPGYDYKSLSVNG